MRQLRLCIRKSLAIYLIMALLVLGSLPTDLMVGADRLADIQKIQSVLESKVVAQRLTDLGLSMQEVQQSMAKLTTEELHQIATNLDGLQAGGDVGIIIAVLLVIALVLLIIFLAKRV